MRWVRIRRDPARGERRLARGWLFAAGAGTVVLSGVAFWPVVSGRTEPPRFTREAAQRAIAEARGRGASRWAPDAMLQAEAAYRQSLLENRVQEVRFLLLRDFRKARVAFDLAEAKARRAAEEAERRKKEAREQSAASLAQAERNVALAEDVADQMHLGPYERRLLHRARTMLAEAAILHQAEEYALASDRSRAAEEAAAQVGSRAAEAASRFLDRGLLAKWRAMVAATVAWSGESGAPAIVVVKDRNTLTLYDGGKPVKTYRVDLGYRSVSDKLRAGDAATPEGRYRIVARKPRSTYYKALLLDYPNEEDRAEFERLRRRGHLPRGAMPGGLIEIHGEGGRGKDWTRGCLALSNRDMDDLFGRVGVGTPVTIVGSDGGAAGRFTELARRYRNGNDTRIR